MSGEDRNDKVDLGVLFVHGIGNQKQTSTLKEGGTLTRALGRWLGPAAVRETELPRMPGDPASGCVELKVGERSLRVVVAEGWWAEEVPAPSAGTLLTWLFSVVPLVIPRVLDAGLRRSSIRMDEAGWRHPLFFGFALVRLGQNVVVVVATLAVLIALVALWLLAWPRRIVDWMLGAKPRAADGPVMVPVLCGTALGAAVLLVAPGSTVRQGVFAVVAMLALITFWTLPRLLNTKLAQFIGDCYALVCQKPIRDAMVDRVEACLTWLDERVDDARVVIVAHSQGAEIVRRVIAERGKQVHGLVTYGSGIAKLDAVIRLRAAPWRSVAALLLRAVSAALVVAAGIAVWRDWPAVQTLMIALAMLLVALAPITLARKLLRSVVGEGYTPDRLGFEPGDVVRWADFFTANDPVAEGKLPIEAWGGSTEIVNCRVLLLDHVKYWHNVEGFCAPVILELAAVVGCGQPADIRAAVATAAAERERRVAHRVRLRLAFLAVAVAGLSFAHGSVQFVVAGAAVLAAAAVEWRLVAQARTRAHEWSPCEL